MKISFFQNLTRAIYTSCFFFSVTVVAVAQSTPQTNESVDVDSAPSTWIQPSTGPAISVSQGVSGVTVTNAVGGMIDSADAAGILNAGDIGIDNVGNIAGATEGVNFVNGQGTGSLINRTSGSITSDSRAINVGDATLISNQGTIAGIGDQRNGTVYADSTSDNFTLNNSGSIDAGVGNEGAGFSAELSSTGNDFTIDNAGTIAGRGNASAGLATAGDGIRLERTRVSGALDATTSGAFTGTISNSGNVTSEGANGTVAGFRAVNGVDFQGTLDNSGTISGTQNGVYFGNPVTAGGGDHTGGAVNNSGTISSDSRALNIDGSGLTVNNSGRIEGTGDQRNGTVYADSTAQQFTLNNSSSGSIDAGVGNEGAGFSAELSSTGNDFTIDNAGTIAGRGNANAGLATAGDGIRLERTRVSGALDATTSGAFTGTISNSGNVTSEGANGTVAGFRAVNGVDFQGTLDNSGTISGTQNGVYFGNSVTAGGGDHTGGAVNNSGTISSDSRALNIDGSGLTVNNSGRIEGTGDQRNGTVYADSTAQRFTLNNSGSIDAGVGNEGAGFAAELSDAGNDFTINNSGEILGRGTAGAGLATAGDGIRLERTRVSGALDASTTGLFTGVINNSGTVSSEGDSGTTAGFRAVNGVSFQGTLNNGGTISGTQNGVYFGNPVTAGGGDHTGGAVNNFGTISSDSRAFNVDGDGLTVNNSGDILATGDQRNGTFYVDGTADNFTLNNSGSVDARGGSGSAVSIQVGSFDGDVQTGTIFNSGSFIGQGDSGSDAGVRLFTNTDGATFLGDIVNEVGGLISSDGSAAFLVEDNVNFDGALINRGEIDGSISLSSGDLQLTDSSVLSLDIFSLTDFESVDVADSIFFDGILELNFAETFDFEVGQTLDLFNFGLAQGSFDSVSSDLISFDTGNFTSTGSLTITSVAAVPEPSSVVVLVFSGLAILRRRRKQA